jgi:hypothetical protein
MYSYFLKSLWDFYFYSHRIEFDKRKDNIKYPMDYSSGYLERHTRFTHESSYLYRDVMF